MTTRVALFDVAGTLVAGNPWRGFLKYDGMSKARVYSRYPFILPPYWAKNWGMISDTRFRQVWVRQMAALLNGFTVDEADTLFKWIATEFMRGDYRDDVVARLREHKQNGDYVLLVSGMFTPQTHQFALALGADAGVGTELVFDSAGRCAGVFNGAVCAGDDKPLIAKRYLEAQGIRLDQVEMVAYADSGSDVPLLSAAAVSVATYPDAALTAVANERGWEVMGGG